MNARSTNSTPWVEDGIVSYTQQYHIQMHRSQLIIENIMNAHSKNSTPWVEDGRCIAAALLPQNSSSYTDKYF